MDLDTIFLDAGGVLVYPNWMRLSDALARNGIGVEPGALAAADPRAKRDLDVAVEIQGTSDVSRGLLYFRRVLIGAGVDESLAASPATERAWAELQEYHARWNLWEAVPAEVPAALDRLRDAGLRLLVVSNANGRLRACFERIGLLRHFHDVVDSCEVGVEKPDPRIFRIALERGGARPERTLHVGDLYQVDVVGARAAGIRAVLLDSDGLYADHDCPRVASLSSFADALSAGML